MAHLRIPARALVVVMVMALATPALADPSAEEKRASAQAKKAQAAAQLDTLRANDSELEAAVRTLDAGVARAITITTTSARAGILRCAMYSRRSAASRRGC
jgi:cell division protein FtsB